MGPGSFRAFTLRFLWDVKAVGGRLSVDKNRGTGKLLDALELLSPYLPSGFVPNAPSSSTLSDLNALAKKLATALPVDLQNWPALADQAH